MAGGCLHVHITLYILELAGIIAHILSKKRTSSKIVRRKFMQQLAEELRAEFMEEKRAEAHGPSSAAHRSRHQNGGRAS